jgi:1-aminocyclopropane-1-carboxylate deaminase/D-cysteine desulfhydrase-like pyridoxal-dependent ACC family enzyme
VLPLNKLNLAVRPTPTLLAERLSEYLGIELWIKRDDLTGDFALGGNKLRKLEYLLADALQKGCDSLLTTGGPYSNHARASAIAGLKVGLKPFLHLAGKKSTSIGGSLFLSYLAGVAVSFSGAVRAEEIETSLESKVEELRGLGYKPYVIPIGGSNALGSRAYEMAVREVNPNQFDWMVLSAGSGGTYAGIYSGIHSNKISGQNFENRAIKPLVSDVGEDLGNNLGNNLDKHLGYHLNTQRINSPGNNRANSCRLLGISPWLKEDELKARIKKIINEGGREICFSSSQALIDDQFIGKGYGRNTAEGIEAIERTAQLEGIFLDHVYTGKAMAGLFSYVKKGMIAKGERVLFWHTGGSMTLLNLAEAWGFS